MRKSALALLAVLALPAQSADDAERMKEIVTFCDDYGYLAKSIMKGRHDGWSASQAYDWVNGIGKESVTKPLIEITTMAYIEPTYSTAAERSAQLNDFRNKVFNLCMSQNAKNEL